MRRNVIGTVLITILVVGALAAAGFGLFQIGYQQGLVETGADVVINRVGPGLHHGYWGFGGPGAFGVFGVFFKILFVFLIFGLIARLFFGRRPWGPPGGPYWARDWEGNHRSAMEQHLTDWHEKAHGEGTPPPTKPDQDT